MIKRDLCRLFLSGKSALAFFCWYRRQAATSKLFWTLWFFVLQVLKVLEPVTLKYFCVHALFPQKIPLKRIPCAFLVQPSALQLHGHHPSCSPITKHRLIVYWFIPLRMSNAYKKSCSESGRIKNDRCIFPTSRFISIKEGLSTHWSHLLTGSNKPIPLSSMKDYYSCIRRNNGRTH